MKIIFPKFTPILCVLLLLLACQDDDDAMTPADCLPPATQTGENTFGCLINGKPWVAEIRVIDPTLRSVEANYDEIGFGGDYGNLFDLSAKLFTDSLGEIIEFSISPLLNEDIFDNTNTQYVNSLIFLQHPTEQFLEIDTLLPFNIEITQLDTLNNYLSGLFDFYATNLEDTIHISNGRFDIKYSPE